MTVLQISKTTYGYVSTTFSLLVALLLVGCKAGENYRQPNVALPESYEYTGGDSTGMAAIEWKNLFEDTVLVRLIEYGLNHSPDLKIAGSREQIAYRLYRQANAAFLPTISLTAGEYVREYHSGNWYSNPSSKYYEESAPPTGWYVNKVQHISSVAASWEVDLWGKFRRMNEEAGARFFQSREFVKLAQTGLVAGIASAYYNLLMLNEQLEIAKANLMLTDSTLAMVRLQFSAGQVTSLAIQQTEAQKMTAATLIPQLEKEIIIRENELNLLIGKYPERLNLSRRLDEVTLFTEIALGVPLELIKNRPDVGASEFNLIAANAGVGVSEAMRYPSLHIGANVGLDAMVFNNLFNPAGAAFGIFTGSVMQPLFQNRRLKTNWEVACLEKEIAEQDFRKSVLLAVNEVSDALANIEKLRQEHEIAKQRIQIAQTAVKNASLLFQSGMATYLEVITAQSNALNSELNLARIKMQLLSANVELYRSLGGGWR